MLSLRRFCDSSQYAYRTLYPVSFMIHDPLRHRWSWETAHTPSIYAHSLFSHQLRHKVHAACIWDLWTNTVNLPWCFNSTSTSHDACNVPHDAWISTSKSLDWQDPESGGSHFHVLRRVNLKQIDYRSNISIALCHCGKIDRMCWLQSL